MKYIMIDLDTPILFPDHINHSDFANNYCGCSQVTSAGFVHIGGKDEYGNPQFGAYGKAVSLRLESSPDDSRIINRVFGTLDM